jgi:hypothetical protein
VCQFAYVYRVLISLHDSPKDFASVQARLDDQTVSNIQQQRKGHRYHLVKVSAHLAHLEAIHPTYCKQTLDAGKYRPRIVRAEELNGDIEEVRPLGGEVVGEDFLERGNKLRAYLWRGGGENGDETVSEGGLFVFWYWFREGVVLRRCPSFRDAVLEVDDS